MKCSNCENIYPSKAVFCGKCGNKIITIHQKDKKESYLFLKVGIFFFAQLSLIIVLHYVDLNSALLIPDLLYAGLIIGFSLCYFKKVSYLLKMKKLNLKILALSKLALILLALSVHFVITFLQNKFGIINHNYLTKFSHTNSPYLLTFISTALFPAIFEEIAFRGILLRDLVSLVGNKSAIILSALLFTILHLSILSVFWIFPIGILFAYLSLKFRTLWYGIIGHFTYNASIVIFEIFLN